MNDRLQAKKLYRIASSSGDSIPLVFFKPKTKPLELSEANLKEMKFIYDLSYQTLTEKHLNSLCNACNA